MKKYLLIGTVIILVIVGGWYIYQSNKSSEDFAADFSANPKTESEQGNVKKVVQEISSSEPQSKSLSYAVTNEHGTLKATRVEGSPLTWEFEVSGSFPMQQDSYRIDFGDESDSQLDCITYNSTEPICYKFATKSHTYAGEGSHTYAQGRPKTIKLFANTRGLGTSQMYELLSLDIQ